MAEASGRGSGERREERFEVEGVRGTFVITATARVTNLGLDGMAIETETALEVGRHYSLVLVRPDRKLRIEGRVVWCSLVRTERDESDEVQAVYRAGIRFSEILTPKAEEVAGFLRDHTVLGLEKRLFGRFRLAREKAATVVAEADFVVREMSLSGMLIETDLALRVDIVYQMQIRLGDVRFDAEVRIARSERLPEDTESGTATHRLGVEFGGLDAGARAALESLREP
jgi:c-di-GMP-binding flagellar brake protein YcgR